MRDLVEKNPTSSVRFPSRLCIIQSQGRPDTRVWGPIGKPYSWTVAPRAAERRLALFQPSHFAR